MEHTAIISKFRIYRRILWIRQSVDAAEKWLFVFGIIFAFTTAASWILEYSFVVGFAYFISIFALIGLIAILLQARPSMTESVISLDKNFQGDSALISAWDIISNTQKQFPAGSRLVLKQATAFTSKLSRADIINRNKNASHRFTLVLVFFLISFSSLFLIHTKQNNSSSFIDTDHIASLHKSNSQLQALRNKKNHSDPKDNIPQLSVDNASQKSPVFDNQRNDHYQILDKAPGNLPQHAAKPPQDASSDTANSSDSSSASAGDGLNQGVQGTPDNGQSYFDPNWDRNENSPDDFSVEFLEIKTDNTNVTGSEPGSPLSGKDTTEKLHASLGTQNNPQLRSSAFNYRQLNQSPPINNYLANYYGLLSRAQRN
jgi:hypothetical protein